VANTKLRREFYMKNNGILAVIFFVTFILISVFGGMWTNSDYEQESTSRMKHSSTVPEHDIKQPPD
jgi:hypothetical protein